jgi:hypothetical protein
MQNNFWKNTWNGEHYEKDKHSNIHAAAQPLLKPYFSMQANALYFSSVIFYHLL